MDRASTTPVCWSIRSARVDFPWSMWAMMQKFRMTEGSVAPGCGTGTESSRTGGQGGGRADLGHGQAYGYSERSLHPDRSLRASARSDESVPVANIKSQIKRNRTNERARLRNKAVKSSLKTATRRFREAVDAGDTAAAAERAKEATRALDKAASKGVIHKNQAANRKSSIASQAAAL
jgi:small subunit ribosomal protein S20